MLFTPTGNIASVSTLLEVEEYRREDFGVWAKLKCVGRVKLLDLQQTDYEYVSATVEPFIDEAEDAVVTLADEAAAQVASVSAADAGVAVDEGSKAAMLAAASRAASATGISEEEVLQAAQSLLVNLDDQVREVHASILELRAQLGGATGGEAPPATATASGGLGQVVSEGERVEWGHELRNEAGEAARSLEELAAARRAVLLSRGLDLPPAAALAPLLGELWGVQADGTAGEAQAERQLLSFAAAAVLSTRERAQALAMRSTSERLTHALCALREQQRRLAAQVALRQAFPSDAGAA